MINFRYHIVSLMAVFLALSIGIVLGVTFGEPVNAGLATQADADRKQVQELRAELDRRRALENYRDEWASVVGRSVGEGVLNGQRVGLVAMPDAPPAVLDSIATAVTDAGGTVVSNTRLNDTAFESGAGEELDAALSPYAGPLGIGPDMSQGTRLGLSLGRSLAGKEPSSDPDTLAVQLRKALTGTAMVDIDEEENGQAQLLVVVTAAATQPPPDADVLASRVDAAVAMRSQAAGAVLAGPNSRNIDGSDVLTVRNSPSADSLSTVDVADLASGVTTVVLAGKEQLLGGQGHYGALAKADSALPEIPVR